MVKIINSQKVNEDLNYTMDTDLVELAGYHAYVYPPNGDILYVNGKKYSVVNTIYYNETGLDALTVKNIQTNEYTIIYVGTDATREKNGAQDLITDVQLLSKLTPEQIVAARDYFNEMEEKYGEISSITGNSLGGGLTNSVAVEHPDVRAVTLNPAILPNGMIDETQEFDNITNYFSAYDVLTTTETSLGLGNRIPGVQYRINNGIPEIGEGFDKLSTNHTGYIRADDGRQYYEIGDGKIYIDADSHIMTSIWTGESLHGGGSSRRIVMNKEHLDMLANALKGDVGERIELAATYLENSSHAIEDEWHRYYIRTQTLKETFESLFDQLAGNQLMMGLTAVENLLIIEINFLHTLLNLAEAKCRSLNAILNSPPVELLEHVFNQDISVESIFDVARRQLDDIKGDVGQLSTSLYSLISDEIAEMFVGRTKTWKDAVVEEFRAHFDILTRNKELLQEQVKHFADQVQKTADDFAHSDQSIAQSIEAGQSSQTTTSSVGQTKVYNLEDSPYLFNGQKLKETHLDIVYTTFTHTAHIKVLPILTTIKLTLLNVESSLTAISNSLKGLTVSLLDGNLPGKLFSMFTNYDEQIKSFVKDVQDHIDEVRLTIEGIHDGIGRLIINFPTLLQNFKPYVDSALFSSEHYQQVHLFNLSTMGILEDMELLFNDIMTQLTNNKSESIDMLSEASKSIITNMSKLYEQVNRCTMN